MASPAANQTAAKDLSDLRFLLLRSWQKPRFLPAETKLVSDKRAGARLVDRRSTRRVRSRDGQAHKRAGAHLVERRSTRRVPSREGQAQKAPQATFSNELRLSIFLQRIGARRFGGRRRRAAGRSLNRRRRIGLRGRRRSHSRARGLRQSLEKALRRGGGGTRPSRKNLGRRDTPLSAQGPVSPFFHGDHPALPPPAAHQN